MGVMISNRIDPKQHKKRSLVNNQFAVDVSRNNFRFVTKLSETGANSQSVVWVAENWEDSEEKFFIKKTLKTIAHQNGRIQSLKNQLKLLTMTNMDLLIEPLYAFQDYSSLYLVTEFIDGFTLEEVLKYHVLSEEEAKYVIVGLVTMLEKIHQQKFILAELCPKNIIVDRKTGRFKLKEIVNPLPINEFYPSDMIYPLNRYSAPEVLMMDRILAQSDFYSLGLILYEIMKTKPAISTEISTRLDILNEDIEVMKSDLPEGWRPEAADFLVKLLMKNPQLRLGRYGSFQIRNHPWLQNYSWSQNQNSCAIDLSEGYFDEKEYETFDLPKQQYQNKQEVNCSYEFQKNFNGYYYRANQFDDSDEDSRPGDSIRERL